MLYSFPKHTCQQLFIISKVLLLNIFNFWCQLNFNQGWINKFEICVFLLVLQSSIFCVCWSWAQIVLDKYLEALSADQNSLFTHDRKMGITISLDPQWISQAPYCFNSNDQHKVSSLIQGYNLEFIAVQEAIFVKNFTTLGALKIYPQIKSNYQRLACYVSPLTEFILQMQSLALYHSQILKYIVMNCPMKFVIIVTIKTLRMMSYRKYYCPLIEDSRWNPR